MNDTFAVLKDSVFFDTVDEAAWLACDVATLHCVCTSTGTTLFQYAIQHNNKDALRAMAKRADFAVPAHMLREAVQRTSVTSADMFKLVVQLFPGVVWLEGAQSLVNKAAAFGRLNIVKSVVKALMNTDSDHTVMLQTLLGALQSTTRPHIYQRMIIQLERQLAWYTSPRKCWMVGVVAHASGCAYVVPVNLPGLILQNKKTVCVAAPQAKRRWKLLGEIAFVVASFLGSHDTDW